MTPLALIVCYAANRVIGCNGMQPWDEPEDRRRFRATTMGHCLIMGRVTYESLPGPLDGRSIIVVTRNTSYSVPECSAAHGIDEACAAARRRDPMPFICGGEEIFRATLPRVTRMYVTELPYAVDGDRVFPAIDEDEWKEELRENHAAMVFRVLRRTL